MSTLFGTNVDFQAEDFLDARQRKAKTKSDLKSWSIPVPTGFEVCLPDGTWYYYDEDYDLEETGHWIPKIASSIEGALPGQSINSDAAKETVYLQAKDPYSLINLTIGAAFSSESELDSYEKKKRDEFNYYENSASTEYDEGLDYNGNGVVESSTTDRADREAFENLISEVRADFNTSTSLEVGYSILPKISWSILKPSIYWEPSGNTVVWKLNQEASEVMTPDSSTVDGFGYFDGPTEWIAKKTYTLTTPGSINFSVTSTIGDRTLTAKTGNITFQYRRFWGSDSLSLWNKTTTLDYDDLGALSSGLSSSGSLTATFNCSGGKYPYIIMPTLYRNTSYSIKVGGLDNSAFVHKTVKITNPRGITTEYLMIRTTGIQTGENINIVLV